MRYAGMLAALFLAGLAFAVLPAALSGYNAAADDTSTELLRDVTSLPEVGKSFSDVHEGYLGTGTKDLTCGNNEVADDVRVYYFGFKRVDGYCDINRFIANGFNEAWSCARSYCTGCSTIEDITDRYTGEETVFASSMKPMYCPIR